MDQKSCQNCIYAVRPKGRAEPALICTNKKGANGSLFFTERRDSCRNFRAKAVIERPKVRQPKNGNIRFIPLTKGKIAIVDAEDYDWLSRYNWHTVANYGRFYAYRASEGKCVAMHRFIMKPPDDLVVDHIDGNSLNNKRANLRICTQQQNLCNRKGRGKGSKYKGISWNKRSKKWRAKIHFNGKCRYLGVFENEIEAARQYDKHAKKLFGEFAYLNFPQDNKST